MVCWANHASAIGHVAATLVDSGDRGDRGDIHIRFQTPLSEIYSIGRSAASRVRVMEFANPLV